MPILGHMYSSHPTLRSHTQEIERILVGWPGGADTAEPPGGEGWRVQLLKEVVDGLQASFHHTHLMRTQRKQKNALKTAHKLHLPESAATTTTTIHAQNQAVRLYANNYSIKALF